jgi:hypothetical protein
MLLVNQHTNVSHEKVISLPLGIKLLSAKNIYNSAHNVLEEKIKLVMNVYIVSI